MKMYTAQIALEQLMEQWRADPARTEVPDRELRFPEFRRWVREAGYDRYMKFRSRMGAEYNAELWFDQRFRQMWNR